MQIKFSQRFDKSYQKLQRKLQDRFATTLFLFEQDPNHFSLKNHALQGEYKGLRSINITGDYRALFRELSNGAYEFVEFIDIGTHSQLY